jgi:hypothetical protein
VLEILKEDMWKTLHPATRLVVKILQHIRSKLEDGAEIRAYFDDNEIYITTYKSEIRITPRRIEFKRRARDSLQVQRVKLSRELNKEVLDVIKNEIVNILEHDYKPNYEGVIETLEKALREPIE